MPARWNTPILHDGAVGTFRQMRGGTVLQRIFSAFPSAWPGIGLLILRASLGVTLVADGSARLWGRHDLGLLAWVAGIVAIASGVSLVIGYLTPLAKCFRGTDYHRDHAFLVRVPFVSCARFEGRDRPGDKHGRCTCLSRSGSFLHRCPLVWTARDHYSRCVQPAEILSRQLAGPAVRLPSRLFTTIGVLAYLPSWV